MKKHLFLFLLTLALVSPAQAATTYDMAYYLGLVTTDSGSTLTDGWWRLNSERGIEQDLQASVYDDPIENAMLIHNDGTYVMISNWYLDTGTNWVLNNTRVFAVGSDYIEFCALYQHSQNFGIIPEKRFRWKRNMAVGDTVGGSGKATETVFSSTIDVNLSLSLQTAGLTIESGNLPTGTGALDNCIRIVIGENTSMNANALVQVLGPGKGPLQTREFQYYNTDLSIGSISAYVNNKVPAWGTGSPYFGTSPGPFTTAGEISSIEALINGLAIPTEYTESTGSGKTIVVPMF